MCLPLQCSKCTALQLYLDSHECCLMHHMSQTTQTQHLIDEKITKVLCVKDSPDIHSLLQVDNTVRIAQKEF